MKKYLVISLMILAFAAALSAQTRSDGTYYSIYGPQFLNGLQSLRLAVQNPRYSDAEIVPCIRVLVIVDFYEAAGDGSVRPRATRRVTRQVELDPGDAASFDLPAALACDGSVCPQVRNGVYANVSVFATPVEGEPLPPGRLKFNSTLALREFARTMFTLPAAEKGFDPQPDPPSAISR
jgi:hypothetical protein